MISVYFYLTLISLLFAFLFNYLRNALLSPSLFLSFFIRHIPIRLRIREWPAELTEPLSLWNLRESYTERVSQMSAALITDHQVFFVIVILTVHAHLIQKRDHIFLIVFLRHSEFLLRYWEGLLSWVHYDASELLPTKRTDVSLKRPILQTVQAEEMRACSRPSRRFNLSHANCADFLLLLLFILLLFFPLRFLPHCLHLPLRPSLRSLVSSNSGNSHRLC